jgi:F-type H+-transporting ATPase subunit b
MRWLSIGICLALLLAVAPVRAEFVNDEAPQAHAGGEAHSGGGHAEGGSEESRMLQLDIPLAVCSALVFLALFGLLWRFAWAPLAKALDDRERYHQETLDKAEQSRAESERLLAEHRGLISKATDEVRAILDEARRDAESTAHGIVTAAQSEASASKVRAERDIATARDQALAEIWTRTADLAVNVAGRVLAREVGPEEHRRLLDRAVNQLPTATPQAEKGRA